MSDKTIIRVYHDGSDHAYGKYEIIDKRFLGVIFTNSHMRWSRAIDIYESVKKILGVKVANELMKRASEERIYTKESLEFIPNSAEWFKE